MNSAMSVPPGSFELIRGISSHPTVFFSHNKPANNIFSYSKPANRTGWQAGMQLQLPLRDGQ
jgi:hypothetical protein